jgi:hypothetical protein
MELDELIRSVLRRWYIVIVLLVAAFGGTWLYHAFTSQARATGTVVVLQAFVAAPGEYIPPQITFDAIDESSELSRRVGARLDDGARAESLQEQIDIGLRVSNRPTLTPLYDVSFSDPDETRAVLIAGIVMDEAIQLYHELNRPAEKDVRAAFAAETRRLEAQVSEAREALARYERENDAFNLVARRDQTRGYLNQLRLLRLQRESGGTGSLLTAARAELERLTSLEAEYARLKTATDLAQVELFRVDGRVSDLMLARPAGEEVQRFLAEAETSLAEAERRYSAAQANLAHFRRVHGVSDVTASRQAQLALVNQLSLAEASVSSGTDSIGAAIVAEDEELLRLESLAPEYQRLSIELSRAEAQLSALEHRILDIVGAQTLPAENQMLVLNQPTLQSNIFWLLITYALATVVAGFAALTMIYLLAIFERRPLTHDDIETRLGVPVLAHIPNTEPRGGAR